MLRLSTTRVASWRCLVRGCSQQNTPEKPVSQGVSEKPINAVGQYYQDLVFRGRQGRLLAVGDLRKLMQLVERKGHVTYAVEAVKLYQVKGIDFTEEVNSHFVSACIRGKSPRAAAELMVKVNYRIGAWSTISSMGKLVEALDPATDAALLRDLFLVNAHKGVRFSAESIVKIFQASMTIEGFQVDEEALHLVNVALYPANPDLVQQLKELAAAKSAAAAAPEAAAVSEGEEAAKSSTSSS